MKRSQKTAETAKRRVARGASNTHPEIPDLEVDFVLKNSFLKYFADKATYIRDPNNFQGSISTHYMTVAEGTPEGVLYSKDGYHFTFTNTNDGKIIEFACEVCVCLCVCV